MKGRGNRNNNDKGHASTQSTQSSSRGRGTRRGRRGGGNSNRDQLRQQLGFSAYTTGPLGIKFGGTCVNGPGKAPHMYPMFPSIPRPLTIPGGSVVHHYSIVADTSKVQPVVQHTIKFTYTTAPPITSSGSMLSHFPKDAEGKFTHVYFDNDGAHPLTSAGHTHASPSETSTTAKL